MGEQILTEEESFKQVLREAIDEGLGVLGESAKLAIYYHVYRRTFVSQEEIPEKLEDFTRALHHIFGIGATVIERQIAAQLYRKLELPYRDRGDYKLDDYVQEAKASLRRRNGL